MATVWIPPLLQDFTDGQRELTIPGDTVRDVITELETRFPGITGKLVEDGRIRPGLSVVVDGDVSLTGLRHELNDDSEVHFLPAISGG